jgi:sugar O-acyltransferase (sialic acid O-acetyltransferase NeuD family)
MIGRNVLVLGGKGQAKVLRPIIEAAGHRICAVFDRDPTLPSPFGNALYLNTWEGLIEWISLNRELRPVFAIAIGGDHGGDRMTLAEQLVQHGLEPITLVHPRAWVAATAQLGSGTQVCAMAAISEEAVTGRQCIINTSASVDHECRLGDGIHVMPGATLAGCVEVGDRSMIGSNAVVLPRVRIGPDVRVGAGAVVTKDVPGGSTVVGNPARAVKPAL